MCSEDTQRRRPVRSPGQSLQEREETGSLREEAQAQHTGALLWRQRAGPLPRAGTVLLLGVVHLGTLAFSLRAKPLGHGNPSKPALSVRREAFEEARWALCLVWEATCVRV